MKNKLLLAFVSVFIALRVNAGTIDFENVPRDYWFKDGNQNLGGYFAGVTFGPDATILEDEVLGGLDWGFLQLFPPRSGHAVLFTHTSDFIDVVFSNPVKSFSFWTSTIYPVIVRAYDSGDNQIDVDSVTGLPGTYQELSISLGAPDISWIRIESYAGQFIIDDFTFSDRQTQGVPDSGATIALLGIALAGLSLLHRRTVRGVRARF